MLLTFKAIASACTLIQRNLLPTTWYIIFFQANAVLIKYTPKTVETMIGFNMLRDSLSIVAIENLEQNCYSKYDFFLLIVFLDSYLHL